MVPIDPPSSVLSPSESAISDTGASGFYLTPKSPCANINPVAVKILVGTSGGPPHQSSESFNILIPNFPVSSGHIMSQFHHNLMGVGPLCNHNCRVVFEKKYFTVYSQDDDVLIRGWRKPKGANLWRFALIPKGHTALSDDWSTGPASLNARCLSSVAALV